MKSSKSVARLVAFVLLATPIVAFALSIPKQPGVVRSEKPDGVHMDQQRYEIEDDLFFRSELFTEKGFFFLVITIECFLGMGESDFVRHVPAVGADVGGRFGRVRIRILVAGGFTDALF